jgi:hypothetical protein
MTPPIQPPEDPGSLFNDGVKAASIGVLAGVARIMLSTEKQTIGYVARRMAVAGIVGFFSSMLVGEYVVSIKLQFCCVGAISYAAPEVCDFVLGLIRQGKLARNFFGKS